MELIQVYVSECRGALSLKDLLIALELDHTSSATKPAPNQFAYVLPGVTGRRTQNPASAGNEWERIVQDFRQWATRRGLSKSECLSLEKEALRALTKVNDDEELHDGSRLNAEDGDGDGGAVATTDSSSESGEDDGADGVLFSAWDDEGGAATEFDEPMDDWDSDELDWGALLTRFPKEFPLSLTERAVDFLDESSEYFFPILSRLAAVDVMSSPKGISILKKVIENITNDDQFPLLAGLLDTIPHGEIVGVLLMHLGWRLRLPVPSHCLEMGDKAPLVPLPQTEKFLLAVWWRLLAEVPVYWNYFGVDDREKLILHVLQSYEEGLRGKNALCLMDPTASGLEQILRCSRITLAIRQSSDAMSVIRRLATFTGTEWEGEGTPPHQVCSSCIQMLLRQALWC
jgi:hypothetical protein